MSIKTSNQFAQFGDKFLELFVIVFNYSTDTKTILDQYGNQHTKITKLWHSIGNVKVLSKFFFIGKWVEGLDAFYTKVNSLHPVSREAFEALLREAIDKSQYQPTSVEDHVKVYLCLDSDSLGKPKTEASKWIVTSPQPKMKTNLVEKDFDKL